MTRRVPISRRTFLRGVGAGVGTAVGLPWLEAMQPAAASAASPVAAANKPPVRLAFIYVPNGIHMADWTPRDLGVDFILPWILEPLTPFRNRTLVLSGLTADKARGNGAGNHARGLAAFLTGCQPKRTSGADIRCGVSADQIAARTLGRSTKFPSLELGCDPSAWGSAACDNGYSCVYTGTMSWRGPANPVPKEIVPRAVFDRLFVRPTAFDRDRAKEEKYRNSILDFVREDAARLRRDLGEADAGKLDEYLTSVREIEMRIQTAENERRTTAIPEPPGVPRDYREHVGLMYDLIALAFATDSTRVATFLLANEFSNRSYAFLNAPGGHHDLSHHGNDPKKHAKLRVINRFHIEQLAHLCSRLRSYREGDGTLLDHCLIACGSGCSDGNSHDHSNLPVLLLGGGGGSIKAGRHVRYAPETPITNLWLAMLDRAGVATEPIGDSTGMLGELA